jgi:acetyltransferase-like isoleucine patch superfamily enzyme
LVRKLIEALIPQALLQHGKWLARSFSRRGCDIHSTADISPDSTLCEPLKVYPGARVWSSAVGAFSYVGEDAMVVRSRIGRFCSIAPRVTIGGGVHPSSGWASTSPVFYSTLRQCGVSFSEEDQFDELPETVVGNDVWIGYGAIVLPGRRIGDGAIVGAGSVVTKDVPSYAVVVGSPARLLRMRFAAEDIEWLTRLQWWSWGRDELMKAAPYFKSIAALREFVTQSGVCGSAAPNERGEGAGGTVRGA